MRLTEKKRNKQIHKEVIISVILYLLYFVWWYITGFVMGDKDPSTYTFIMGLPVWFILNSIVGPILFITAVIFTIKCFFVEVDLEDCEEEITKKEE
ncbi:MAG: YhdT family protein [Clostridium sp.]